MNEKEALIHLKKAALGMKKLGFDIKGLRAPQMSRPGYEIIKKAGFSYDSSMHPTWIPGYYNNFFQDRKITKNGDLVIVPLSVSPVIRMPMSWIWFRNFGLFYEKIVTKLNFIDMDFANIYFHPWEFTNLEKFDRYLSVLVKRNTGEKFRVMLEEYIVWCRSAGYKFSTISEYLRGK